MWRLGDGYTATDVLGDIAADIMGIVVTILKVWALRSSKTLVFICQSAQRQRRCEDLKSGIVGTGWQGLRIWALWESAECACEDTQHADSQ